MARLHTSITEGSKSSSARGSRHVGRPGVGKGLKVTSAVKNVSRRPFVNLRKKIDQTGSKIIKKETPSVSTISLQQNEKSGTGSKHTVFIRNVPFLATNDNLREVLSGVAVTKRVNIVKDKDGRSKGFCFAEFTDDADVQKVVSKLNGYELMGRQLSVEPVIDKSLSEIEKKSILASKRMKRTGLLATGPKQLVTDNSITLTFSPSLTITPFRAVVLISCLLPSSIKVVKVLYKPGNEKESPVWNFEFQGVKEAASVATLFNGLLIPVQKLLPFFKVSEKVNGPANEGNILVTASCLAAQIDKVLLAETDTSDRKNPAQLVIRNLSFQATEQQLFHVVKEFGFIRKMRMAEPKDLNAKEGVTPLHGGYAFISYRTLENARRAMEELNGKMFFGRKLAVDWGIDGKAYKELKSGIIPLPKPDFDRLNSSLPKGSSCYNAEMSDDDNDKADGSSDNFEQETQNAKSQVLTLLKMADCNNNKNLTEKNETVENTSKTLQDDASVSSQTELTKKKTTPKAKNDITEGKTIHIRNIAFDATEDDIKESFSPFGKIVYTRMINDNEGRFKGTAFLKFQEKESADKVILQEDNTKKTLNEETVEQSKLKRHLTRFTDVPLEGLGILVKGRRVRVGLALPKSSAEELELNRKKDLKLKKNAHLADVGYIAPDDPNSNGMSKGDIQRRLAARKEKNVKLNNPNYVINPYRLSIRNLPSKLGKEDLRKVILDFCVSNPQVQNILTADSVKGSENKAFKSSAVRRLAEKQMKHLTLCVDDQKDLVKQVASTENNLSAGETNSRSKGFGFVTFISHDVALHVLNYLNNNTTLFGDTRRPIVDFALEDKRALRHHELMAEKVAQDVGSNYGKKRKTFSRGRVQREKKRQQREMQTE